MAIIVFDSKDPGKSWQKIFSITYRKLKYAFCPFFWFLLFCLRRRRRFGLGKLLANDESEVAFRVSEESDFWKGNVV